MKQYERRKIIKILSMKCEIRRIDMYITYSMDSIINTVFENRQKSRIDKPYKRLATLAMLNETFLVVFKHRDFSRLVNFENSISPQKFAKIL